MASKSATALIGVGVFSLSLAGLTLAVAQPALIKAPLTKVATSVGVGPATALDAATGKQVAGTFTSRRVVGTERLAGKKLGNSDVAVYRSLTTNTFTTTSTGTTAVKSRADYTQAFDRKTGAGVPSAKGDTANTTAHIFKLPFHTEKKTYELWDSQAEKAFPLIYSRSFTYKGVPVYEFTQDVPATDMGVLPVLKAVPGALVGHPEAPSIAANEFVENLGKRIYVEPVTGSLVGGVSNPHVWAQTTAAGLSGLKLDLLKVDGASPDAASTAELIKDTKDSKASILLLERAPWALGALGLVLLGAGILLGRRKRTIVLPAETAGRPDVSGALPTPRSEPAVDLTKAKR